MTRALALAARGAATTHPNPRVGCVVVRDGVVVGEGWHERAGGPHAEVVALAAAGDAARGADLYVTLEPCSHHGRTPPCADAVVAAGVARVIAAMEDPNPRVAGQGLARLRDAGVGVDIGDGAAAAGVLNAGFISRMTRGRPQVVLKLAASLDGRTAMASGESQWITSDAARADVHRRRAEAGAVLTSSATVLADDPRLTVRLDGDWRQPDRIVLDAAGRVPPAAAVWATGARRIALVGPTCPVAHRDALTAIGVEVIEVPAREAGIDLAAALQLLGRAEINTVLVECGPVLAGALLRARLVDVLEVYLAPCLLGDNARPLARLPGLTTLAQAPRLEFESVERVGADLRVRLVPAAGRE